MKAKKSLISLFLLASVLTVLGGCSLSDADISALVSKVRGEDTAVELSGMQSNVYNLLAGFMQPQDIWFVGDDDYTAADDGMNLQQLVASCDWRIVSCAVDLPDGNYFVLRDNVGATLYIVDSLNYLVLDSADGTTQVIQSDSVGEEGVFPLLADWAAGLENTIHPVLDSLNLSVQDGSRLVPIDNATQRVGMQLELSVKSSPDTIVVVPTWHSSDTAVATVDQNGVVTCLAVGKCEISARYGDYSDTLALTVID